MTFTSQTGADYLRQILRAPVYDVAMVTPLQDMPGSQRDSITESSSNAKIANQFIRLNCAVLTT